jgi:hypothetical protein
MRLIFNIVLDNSDWVLIVFILELYLGESVESTKDIVISRPQNERHNNNNNNINLSNESFEHGDKITLFGIRVKNYN